MKISTLCKRAGAALLAAALCGTVLAGCGGEKAGDIAQAVGIQSMGIRSGLPLTEMRFCLPMIRKGFLKRRD